MICGPSIRQYKKPRRLEPRGWSSDGCTLEKLNKIPKGLSTEYKQAGKAWAQFVQDKAQYVQDYRHAQRLIFGALLHLKRMRNFCQKC